MHMHLKLLVSLLVVSSLVAGACGDDDDAEGDGETQQVRIGANVARSGPLVAYGRSTVDGVRIAVDEINEAGGFKVNGTTYTLELVERDNRSDEGTAVAVANELIEDLGVKFMFGPLIDNLAAPVQELTQPAGVIHMSASSVFNNLLTTKTVAPGGAKHYLFKTHSSDQVRDATYFAASDEFLGRHGKEVLLIPNDEIGQRIGPEIADRRREMGVTDFEVVYYPFGTQDFSSILTRIRGMNPEIVHLWYFFQDELIALRQAMELGVAPRYTMFANEPAVFREEIPEVSAEVVIMCNPLCWDKQHRTSDAAGEYWDKFEAAGGSFEQAAGFSLHTYDFVYMLVEAMQKAGTVDDTDAIVQALEDLQYEGGVLNDVLKFDERHVVTHGWDFCLATGADMKCRYFPPVVPEAS